jgi:hypothetical protein
MTMTLQPRLHVVPITLRLAAQLNRQLHRHAPGLSGALWAVGIARGDLVLGTAVVGRPKARMLDSGALEPKLLLEVTRVAVPAGLEQDGHGGAASMLYGAVSRACHAQGTHSLMTYTRTDEKGTTLVAAGWYRELDLHGQPAIFGGGQWGRPSRGRATSDNDSLRHRWWTTWSAQLAVIKAQLRAERQRLGLPEPVRTVHDPRTSTLDR